MEWFELQIIPLFLLSTEANCLNKRCRRASSSHLDIMKVDQICLYRRVANFTENENKKLFSFIIYINCHNASHISDNNSTLISQRLLCFLKKIVKLRIFVVTILIQLRVAIVGIHVL